VRDVEARDRYRRLLVYVYRRKDGLFVNLAMARDGFAAALTIPPNVAHTDEFVTAAGEARESSRGLWGRCGGPDTPLGSGA
jgi:micrococcal nuclease